MQYSLPCSPFVKYRCRQLHINSSGMQKRMEIEPSETVLTELVLPYDQGHTMTAFLETKRSAPFLIYLCTLMLRPFLLQSRPADTIESYSNTIDSSQTWSYLASPVVPYPLFHIPLEPYSTAWLTTSSCAFNSAKSVAALVLSFSFREVLWPCEFCGYSGVFCSGQYSSK